jgi:hypothetical protein
VPEHENLEILGSVAAADEHDQLEHPADHDYKADTGKGDLWQTGPPTLPASQPPSRMTDRVFAPHGVPTPDGIGNFAAKVQRFHTRTGHREPNSP